jgi:hypothetical protein
MYIGYLNGPVFSVSKYWWRFQLLSCTSRVQSAEKCNLKTLYGVSVVCSISFCRFGHMTRELMDVVSFLNELFQPWPTWAWTWDWVGSSSSELQFVWSVGGSQLNCLRWCQTGGSVTACFSLCGSHCSYITSDVLSDIGSILSLLCCLLWFILGGLMSCANNECDCKCANSYKLI